MSCNHVSEVSLYPRVRSSHPPIPSTYVPTQTPAMLIKSLRKQSAKTTHFCATAETKPMMTMLKHTESLALWARRLL
jgi:hypothetical protein